MTDQPIAYTAEGRPLYDNTASVVCLAVFNELGETLLVKRATNPGKGLWALPGGFHMRGETWQQCGAREVYEEVGLELEDKYHGVQIVTDEYHHNVIMSFALDKGTKPLNPNAEEVEEARWVSNEEARGLEWAFPVHRNFLLGATFLD